MAITVWPVDAVAGAPSYTGRMLREAQSVHMAGATATDPFGVRSGVRPGTSPTTITATSTTWTVAAHAGALDLETAVEASGYCYAVNATGGLPTDPVTAANATYPRHDVVYAHLDDPAESDGSSVPAVTFGYVAGTVLTAGTLEITALPARSVAYATISVPISGGGSPTVIWVAPYTVAAGAPIPVYSAADRDAKFPAPYAGLKVYLLDLHCTHTYNGSVWRTDATPITYNDGGIVTSGTVNVATTAVRTVTDPFGAGVPYHCRTTYYLGYVTGAGITARACVYVNAALGRWAMISPAASAAPSIVTDMSVGGTVTFQAMITNLTGGTVATVADGGAHVMVTEVTPS